MMTIFEDVSSKNGSSLSRRRHRNLFGSCFLVGMLLCYGKTSKIASYAFTLDRRLISRASSSSSSSSSSLSSYWTSQHWTRSYSITATVMHSGMSADDNNNNKSNNHADDDKSTASVKLAHIASMEQTAREVFQPTMKSSSSFEIVSVSLPLHRPLGCTIDESLAAPPKPSLASNTNHNHGMNTIIQAYPFVFVSRVIPNGYADQAGIQEGDVILGVSGIFGDLDLVLQSGIDKIKGLVSSRPDDDALELVVVRGTTVMADHEQALVDMCSQYDFMGNDVMSKDAMVDQCVLEYLQDGYIHSKKTNGKVIEPTILDDDDDDATTVDGVRDDDAENLLHTMYTMWDDELPQQPSSSSVTTLSTNNAHTNKLDTTKSSAPPKPWSSRSSPSGTYVRDPVTGKIVNLDR